jgi:hypothetical protein
VREADSGVGEPLRDGSTPGVSELVSDAVGDVVRDGDAVHAGVPAADGSGSGASDAGGGGGGGTQLRSPRGTSQHTPRVAPHGRSFMRWLGIACAQFSPPELLGSPLYQ